MSSSISIQIEMGVFTNEDFGAGSHQNIPGIV